MVFPPKKFKKWVYKKNVLSLQDSVFPDRIGIEVSHEELPKGFLVKGKEIIIIWDGNHRIANALLNDDWVTIEVAVIDEKAYKEMR